MTKKVDKALYIIYLALGMFLAYAYSINN